jgi:transketolase
MDWKIGFSLHHRGTENTEFKKAIKNLRELRVSVVNKNWRNMSKAILKNKPKRSEEVEKWLQEEFGEQKERYEKIAKEMNIDLAAKREVWIQEFYERITTTGFYWHADNKRIIKKEELFQKPDREFKVVF